MITAPFPLSYLMMQILRLLESCSIFIQNLAIFVQNDGVAMGSPLSPILAGIVMVELENTPLPKLKQHIKNWRRYADDVFIYVKNGSVDYVLSVLETFHPNIKYTYKKEVITHYHF